MIIFVIESMQFLKSQQFAIKTRIPNTVHSRLGTGYIFFLLTVDSFHLNCCKRILCLNAKNKHYCNDHKCGLIKSASNKGEIQWNE